jgi:hypothetical protein
VWIVLASMVERVNLRYLLPLAPIMSVAAAHAWKEADPARLLRACQPGWWLSIAALTVASTASAVITVYLGHIVTGLLLIGAAAWIIPTLVSAGRRADALELSRLAVTACLLMFAAGSVGLAHLVLPDVGARIAQELRELPLASSDEARAVWVGEPAVAARARVHLQGEIPLGQASPERLEAANIVLLRNADASHLDAEWSVVRTFTHGYRGMDVREVLQATLAGKVREFLEEKRQHITIAVRRDESVIVASHTEDAGEHRR